MNDIKAENEKGHAHSPPKPNRPLGANNSSNRDKALHHHPKLAPELVNSNRPGIAPMPFESPNARSKTITVADGPNTGGVSVYSLPISYYLACIADLLTPPIPLLVWLAGFHFHSHTR
ncbi:hypothetical protein FRB91_002722 [Serendipita sp. 411]|nr:hypothetical protein FRB91_002722 [Serendipita sp. 411]